MGKSSWDTLYRVCYIGVLVLSIYIIHGEAVIERLSGEPKVYWPGPKFSRSLNTVYIRALTAPYSVLDNNIIH